jgi:hypothetical protein
MGLMMGFILMERTSLLDTTFRLSLGHTILLPCEAGRPKCKDDCNFQLMLMVRLHDVLISLPMLHQGIVVRYFIPF